MEGNSVGLITTYVTNAKGKKPTYTKPNEYKEASKLFGMDLSYQDKEKI